MSSKRPVLLVDDEFHVTRALSYLLENNSFSCLVRNSADNVMDLMEKEHPLVVLLDINMPGLNGLDLLRQIREQGRFADTKIIILSGQGQQKNINAAYELGADDYIVKPFNPIELRDKILEIYATA